MSTSKSKPLVARPLEATPVRGDAPSIRQLEMLAQWMDSIFEIPGLGIRFGIDAIVGLIPGFGDTLTMLASLYILKAAGQYGVPKVTILRMTINTVIDMVLGSLPLVGDLFDVAWKSNHKNVALLKKALGDGPAKARRTTAGDWLVVIAAAGVLLATLVGSLVITYWIVAAIYRAIAGA